MPKKERRKQLFERLNSYEGYKASKWQSPDTNSKAQAFNYYTHRLSGICTTLALNPNPCRGRERVRAGAWHRPLKEGF